MLKPESTFPAFSDLLRRYDVPVPRYTSYPPVPFWKSEHFSTSAWLQSIHDRFVAGGGDVSLYLHLPFCEALCTYCACNKRITRNHGVEAPYLEALKREWSMYRAVFGATPRIREIHLGGGTPTFFHPDHLEDLILFLLDGVDVPPGQDFSIEVHPGFTQRAHLEKLAALGFNRISVGVQDFDPRVQHIINRVQTEGETRRVVEWARELGFSSVNFDLIYGLPLQTVASIHHTLDRVATMQPDRIAYYSYAHVPWKSKGQRRYTDAQVPVGEEKIAMFEAGTRRLEEMGYRTIGMDHFALPGDPLFAAFAAGSLHRNFMGYTRTRSSVLVGLGASAIGDSWTGMAQNEKEVERYQDRVMAGEFPVVHGHLLTADDAMIRSRILDIMCRLETNLDELDMPEAYWDAVFPELRQLAFDGLVEVEGSHVKVTPIGIRFLRNIAAVLDPHLHTVSQERVFSRAV